MPSPVVARVVRRYRIALHGMPVDSEVYLDAIARKLQLDARLLSKNVQALERATDSAGNLIVETSGFRGLTFDMQLLGTLEKQFTDFAKRFGPDTAQLRVSRFERDSPLIIAAADVPESDVARVFADWEYPAIALRAYLSCLTICRETVVRIAALRTRLEAHKNVNDPKVEKIEKLYHASIAARELAQKGFELTRPEGNFGLGGSVADKSGHAAISFTYDAKYAMEIARWLKELAHVAHGDLSAQQVMRLAEADHVSAETLKRFTGIKSVGDIHHPGGATELRYEHGRWKAVNVVWSNGAEVESPGDMDLLFSKKDQVYDLYVAYILSNRSRRSPVMMNPVAVLDRIERERIDPRDIGVIVAEVDMTDPDIRHVPAEREYRVPPRAIKRVIRFLGD